MACQSQVQPIFSGNDVPYTQVANVVLEDWAYRLKHTELMVLLFITRKTAGWHRQTVEISIDAIAKTVKRSRSMVKNAVKSLDDLGLIDRNRMKFRNGGDGPNSYVVTCWGGPIHRRGGAHPSAGGGRSIGSLSKEKALKKNACSSGDMGGGVGEGSAGKMPPPPKTSPPSEESKNPPVGAKAPPPANSPDTSGSQGNTGVGPTLEREVETVRASLGRFAPADTAGARRLLADCRRRAPDCTAAEVVAFINRKAHRLEDGAIDNPIGWFIRVIPFSFEGNYKAALNLPPPKPPGLCRELRRDSERFHQSLELYRAFRQRGLI